MAGAPGQGRVRDLKGGCFITPGVEIPNMVFGDHPLHIGEQLGGGAEQFAQVLPECINEGPYRAVRDFAPGGPHIRRHQTRFIIIAFDFFDAGYLPAPRSDGVDKFFAARASPVLDNHGDIRVGLLEVGEHLREERVIHMLGAGHDDDAVVPEK